MLTAEATSQVNTIVDVFAFPRDTIKAEVLIVAEEVDIRSALVRILSLEGCMADEVSSGFDALNFLERKLYDLMVLDMYMPDMSGMELLQNVQQICPKLLVIILTGNATLDSAVAAAKSEAVVDYLLKPVNPDKFVNTIVRALQKQAERWRQQTIMNAAAQMLAALRQSEMVPAPAFAPGISSLLYLTPKTNSERFIEVPPLRLDCQKRLVTIVDNPTETIALTKGEVAILASLMTHPNQVLTCSELVCGAFGYEIEESDAKNITRPYIFRLRHKLEPNPQKPCLICTIWRRGYRFTTF